MGTLAERPTCTRPRQTLQEETVRPLSFPQERVVTETCYLLLERLGPLSEQRFLRSFASGLDA